METEVGLTSVGRVNMIKTHTQFSKDIKINKIKLKEFNKKLSLRKMANYGKSTTLNRKVKRYQ